VAHGRVYLPSLLWRHPPHPRGSDRAGILLSLYVLYIIWMALFLYHVVNDAGVIRAIGQELPKVTSEKTIQVLLLAWIFGAFLQGASGYGVPAAVVAPLLVGLGFAPVVAVAAALIGHAWAVTFGSLGSSFLALVAASGVPGEVLASPTAVYMGIACLLCGLVVMWTFNQWQALREGWFIWLVVGLVMAGTQWLLAVLGLWTIASFGAGAVGLLVAIPLARWRTKSTAVFHFRPLAVAFFPYIILTAVIIIGQLILGERLDIIEITYQFPATSTTLGYASEATSGPATSLFGHAGALLFYAALLAFAWYKWRGVLPTATSTAYSGRRIVRNAARSAYKSSVSIVALVGMATIMEQTGMTAELAQTLSQAGLLFPLLSPFIGALGAFMTGSNTNSNVVFAGLQASTAQVLGLSVGLILAAQTAGGALGSIFAPAKVIVGCSTVEGVDEGAVLKLATFYGLGIVAVLGVLTLLLTH
jgi:lactate permease